MGWCALAMALMGDSSEVVRCPPQLGFERLLWGGPSPAGATRPVKGKVSPAGAVL
ncbi:hypothetical protein HMPREF0262_03271 [Clostridium sp. ATCC 29733]|nr:hypothetical protein HMPREF0262_03271 [Clostridium sp. ATCC 29733]